MPWWTIPLATTAVQTGANLLAGDSEAEKFYKKLRKEYRNPEGFTPEQKAKLRYTGKTQLGRELSERAKSVTASAGRRGERLGPQALVELEGKYGQAYGDYLPQIDLASEDYKEQKKQRILEMLGASAGGLGGNTLDLSGLSKNLTLLQLLNNAGKTQGTGGDNSGLPPIDWSQF